MEAYLGPNRPRWSPKDEAAIRGVVQRGWLAESHHIDVKREVGESRGGRKETARDLASFAIDGGALLIGIEEDKANRTFLLTPQPLNGLMERLEQVAAFVIDPPLTIIPEEIPSRDDPTIGYLLVHVPPSSFAPHMVGGQYFGRGERTRRQLGDAEVLRLHTRRRSQEDEASRLLDIEIARDPVPEEERRVGHLYLVAQPIGAPRRIAHGLVRGDANLIHNLVRNSPLSRRSDGAFSWEPAPRNYADTRSVRSNGAALCSYALSGRGRTLLPRTGNLPNDSGTLLDVEIREDGGVRVLVGRVTDRLRQNPNDHGLSILDALAVAYARRIVDWAAAIGEATGWLGSWILGFHGDRLRGLSSAVFRQGMFLDSGPAFDEDSYREITVASHLEMLQRPGAVAKNLVGRLTDSLGTTAKFEKELADVPDSGEEALNA
jgi:hypothetical protein